MARKASTKSNDKSRRVEPDQTTAPSLTAKGSDAVDHHATTTSESRPSDLACPGKENVDTRYSSTQMVQDDLTLPSGTETPKRTTVPTHDHEPRPFPSTRGAPGKLHADCGLQEQLKLFRANDGYQTGAPNSGCLGCDLVFKGWLDILRTGPKNDIERFLVDLLTGAVEPPEPAEETNLQEQPNTGRETPSRPARQNTTTANPFGAMDSLYREVLLSVTRRPPLDPRPPRSRARPLRMAGSPRTLRQGQRPPEEEAEQSAIVTDPPTYHTRALKRPLDPEHEIQPAGYQAEITRRQAWTPSRKAGWREQRWWRPDNGL